MDIITIFQVLQKWGLFALGGGVVLALGIFAGYMIYKKVFHGQKQMSKTQGISLFLLCSWLALVLGLTTISRGANFTGSFNIDFFSSYVNAWNKWSISELQLIIFNMLMFVPLGFLLPLIWKEAEKFKVTFLVSLGFTLLIEIVQFLTGTGIFEFDDLFHNLLGSLFGYFLIMAVLSIIREKRIRFAPLAKVLMFPLVIGMIIGIVWLAYDKQTYGNMTILPATKQDMSEIQVLTNLSLSDQEATASIFENRYTEDLEFIEQIKNKLSELENVTFSGVQRREGDTRVYIGKSSDGEEVQLNFFFRTGQWSYNSWHESVKLSEDEIKRSKDTYGIWLKENGLLPDTAVFSVQNDDMLRWDTQETEELPNSKTPFPSGPILLQFDSDLKLASMYYGISWNDFVATEKIISPDAAFQEVENGNFEQYVPFQQGDTLWVKEYELAYVYDTKGFLQPVYQFTGYINNQDNIWTCQIPALFFE
ncbi:MAG: VanZ family protein [Anaerolineaceae bacterium]|jgi:glycopeptide antibiotics resistance protein